MRNIKITIEYKGTNYCGWQSQKNGTAIQQVIEKALFKLTKEEIRIHGSGRTDKGVHALGQTASFLTNSTVPPHKFNEALNTLLPDDIAIVSSSEVDMNFHARYSAKGKQYRYKIYNNKIRSPLHEDLTGYIKKTLDLDSMKEALKYFEGTHDFYGFMSSGSSIKNTVRNIYKANLYKEGNVITIDLEGNGFLYNMVRIIAGTLVDVGRNKTSVKDIESIIESKNRKMAGKTLPPQGLYLIRVIY